jgi:RHS repeat-associated protein
MGVMLTLVHQTSAGEACLAPKSVGLPEEEIEEFPQASYYRARYYDPSPGRFLSEDPARFGGGFDFYAYVKNDPVDFTDPTGLKCWQSSSWTEVPSMSANGPSPYLTVPDGLFRVPTGWSYFSFDLTHCICSWIATNQRVHKYYRVTIKEQAQFTCDCPASTYYETRDRTKEYEVDGPGNRIWSAQNATTSGTTFQFSDQVGSNPKNKRNVNCLCLPPAP